MRPSRRSTITLLPLPRPHHKPLRERAIYAAMAARTTFATTGVGASSAPTTPQVSQPIVAQPVAAEVPGGAVVALETEPRRKRGERAEETGEEEAERAREEAPVVSTALLAYALLLGLTALGLGIAGGATNYWVSVRCAASAQATRLVAQA